MANVTLSQIKKQYGNTPVIHGVDIEAADGEFVVLVGPSGCGKSTLLRMIAGLETISSGTLKIGDRVVNDLDPKDRDIAMVFQNYALYPHMTVETNMGFSLEHRGGTKSEIAERVKWAAEILDLSNLLMRYPRQLSGGQRQRVAMGRAIVRDPQVFLFDEPLSNLDAKLRVAMRAEIKSLHRKLKTTTIYVTHDQVEAMTMADKIVVMNAGEVSQVGAPLDLYDRPANRFVAGFIGSPSMNFIDGVVENGHFTAPGIDLKTPSFTAGKTSRQLICGIRPEHLVIGGEGISAEVILVEPMGSETQVTFSLPEGTIVGVFRDRIAANPGDVMTLGVQTHGCHFFDPVTDLRVK